MKYLVPMVSTMEGYTAELNVFLDNISVTSSLNDIRLLEADSCFVRRSFIIRIIRGFILFIYLGAVVLAFTSSVE